MSTELESARVEIKFNHYRKSNKGFWNGFFMGYFASIIPPRRKLDELRYTLDGLAEDQKRIGNDMYVALGIVSKESGERNKEA